MKKYNVIIPAAGSARRLRPFTSLIPKSLLEIKNKPIIKHQLDNLPVSYVKRVIVVLGYEGDQLKNYINSLNLHYPVIYCHNKNYTNTNCAYSLLQTKDYMLEGFVLLNCDLLFKKANILKLLNSHYLNTVNVRKNREYKTDLQDIFIDKEKIIKWSLNVIDANAEVMGPLKICAIDAEKVINYFDSLSEPEKEKIHCFSLFSKLVNIIDYHPVYIDDKTWIEIDTPKDLEKGKLIWGE